MTALTTRRVRCGVGARSICQPNPLPGIKSRSSPHCFSINSLHPFSSLFSCRGVSCLRPLASSTFPSIPSLRARGPTERYDEASQKNTSTRLMVVIRSKSRQHFLVNCLTVGLPPIMTKGDADDLPDFQLISLQCSPTVTRSVPSPLNESSTPPSNVLHDDAALAR